MKGEHGEALQRSKGAGGDQLSDDCGAMAVPVGAEQSRDDRSIAAGPGAALSVAAAARRSQRVVSVRSRPVTAGVRDTCFALL
uniref:Uncharacterized protein n=1 Tax=Plectus sambesii TaxID=2011161 RepID=A0A914XGL4_9BILA